MVWDAKSGSAPLAARPGDGEVAVVLGSVPVLHEVHEAALGELVGAAAEQAQRGARRRVGEAGDEGSAVECEEAAVVLEDGRRARPAAIQAQSSISRQLPRAGFARGGIGVRAERTGAISMPPSRCWRVSRRS